MSRPSRQLAPVYQHAWAYYIVGALIFCALFFSPMQGIFSDAAQRTVAVFGVAAFFWISGALPMAVTGLLVLLLLPMTGAISVSQTYSSFGNSAVFFVLGAFILASPVMRSGLSTRVAVRLLSRFGHGPIRLLLTIFLLSSFAAFFISEHAVAAMLYPICLEIIKAAKEKQGSRFAFCTFLSMGWGAIIGGTATLLGGARAPLALGMMEAATHKSISFIQWFVFCIPIVLVVMAVSFLVIYLLARRCNVALSAAHAQLEVHRTALGTFSAREKRTVFVVVLTVILWIVFGRDIGLDMVAFFGVILAFVLRITSWDEVQEDVQWSIFIMYGSAIALSAALRDTGAANDLVKLLVQSGLSDPIWLFVAFVILAGVLTEAMSNAAAVAVLMPIALVIATQFGIDPRAITVAIATSAGLTFLLPVSTPAMTIMTNSPYVHAQKAMAWGVVSKVVGIIVILVFAFYYWPLLGLTV